jgi:predicted RNase H-like HicB family nuclease
MNTMLNIVIEKDSIGYVAYCPALAGCMTQGETFEEVMHNIREAVELYLETLSADEISALSKKEVYTTALAI